MLLNYTDTHTHTYIVVSSSCLTLVEGDSKLPFSIAITPRCRVGRDSFLWIALHTLDPYLIIQSVENQVPFFKSFVRLDLGFNLVSRIIIEHYIYIYVCIYI